MQKPKSQGLTIVAAVAGDPERLSGQKRSELGDLIRRLRDERGWTLADASRRCSLSLSTISRVENNQLSLTFDNLLKLADGFGIDVVDLFQPDLGAIKSLDWTLTRHGEGQKHESSNYQHLYLSTEFDKRRMIPLVSTVKARSLKQFGMLLSHPGHEFLFILEDAIDVVLENHGSFRLRAGDSFYFNSAIPHALMSVGAGDARVLSVMASTLTGKSSGASVQPV